MSAPERPATAPELRDAVRRGVWTGPTSGAAPDQAQANLVIVPGHAADAFAAFADANPRSCPVIDRTEPGDPTPPHAGEIDLRTDVPRYRVFRDGVVTDEPTDVRDLWRDDLVAFLLGCSFSFESAMMAAGLPLRHVDQGRNVPMFVTDREVACAGPFAGPLVVSMRPLPPDLVDQAVAVTAPYTLAHGGPVHAGNPGAIGIVDVDVPDFGERVDREPGDVSVFWACGVTPQLALADAGLDLVITHAPGHMVVTDLPHTDLAPGA